MQGELRFRHPDFTIPYSRLFLINVLLGLFINGAAAPLNLLPDTVTLSSASRRRPYSSQPYDARAILEADRRPVDFMRNGRERMQERDHVECSTTTVAAVLESFVTSASQYGSHRISINCAWHTDRTPAFRAEITTRTTPEPQTRSEDFRLGKADANISAPYPMYLPKFLYRWACDSDDVVLFQSRNCMREVRLLTIWLTVGVVLFAAAALFVMVYIHKWRRRNSSYKFSLASLSFRPNIQRSPIPHTRSSAATPPQSSRQEDYEGGVPCGLDGVQDGWTAWVMRKRAEESREPISCKPMVHTPRLSSLRLPTPTLATVRQLARIEPRHGHGAPLKPLKPGLNASFSPL